MSGKRPKITLAIYLEIAGDAQAASAAIDDVLDWGEIQDAILQRAKDAEYGRFTITSASVDQVEPK